MKRTRRPWTPREDQLVRQFHAEGKHDGIIGYILGRQRARIAVHRRKLGLPPHKRPPSRGWTRSAATRAKISEANRQRWQDPVQRPKLLRALARAKAKQMAVGTFRPPRGTAAFKRYIKVCSALGPQAARAALAAGEI